MKITAAMIVFNGDHVLNESLASIYDYVDEILVAEGPVEFWQHQGCQTSSDKTNEILRDFHDPEKKLRVVHSQYHEKDEQFRSALSLMTTKTDYLLQVDSDEVWTYDSLKGLDKLLHEKSPISVGIHSNTFIGGFDRVISGFEEKTDNFLRVFKWEPSCGFVTHRPPTVVYADGNRTKGRGHVDSDEARDYYGISMCHYSYVWPTQVKSKIDYYRAKVSMQNCIPDFYESFWLPWTKTESLEKKWEIEAKILGMHEFQPEVRGPAFTKNFVGEHPVCISNSMNTLKLRLTSELGD